MEKQVHKGICFLFTGLLLITAACEKQETRESVPPAEKVSHAMPRWPGLQEHHAPPPGMPAEKNDAAAPVSRDRPVTAPGPGSSADSREAAAAAGYVAGSRLDPFMPLIPEPAPASPEPGGPAKPGRILTPLEKMTLSQVRLKAVVISENRKLAMVEEATGKGYEVGIGTYMGENGGQVVDISFDGLVVKEMVMDSSGSLTPRLQKIKFHKPDSGE